MTATRDPDRLLRAWLDLMPDEAPDRVIASVLQATGATPQVRGARWPAVRRFPSMNRFTIAAATAAAIAIAVVGVTLLLRPPTDVGPPTASPAGPTASPVPPLVADVPAELRSGWLGAHRSLSGIAESAGTFLSFEAGSMAISQSTNQDRTVLLSKASLAADGRLRLETSADGDCPDGSVGIYSFALSVSGETLELVADSDDCSARPGAVTGTWWRVDCNGKSCLGLLDSGTYGSQYFQPDITAVDEAAWVPIFGAFRYDVPVGWANADDWPTYFRLTPAANFANETSEGPPDDDLHDVYVGAQPRALLQDSECIDNPVVDPDVAVDVEAIIASIDGLPAFETTHLEDLPLGVVAAPQIDLVVAADWTGGCSDWAQPNGSYLTAATAGWRLNLMRGERTRLIFLTIGQHAGPETPDDLVVVAIRSSDPATFDELVAAAMPIIESMQFE